MRERSSDPLFEHLVGTSKPRWNLGLYAGVIIGLFTFFPTPVAPILAAAAWIASAIAPILLASYSAWLSAREAEGEAYARIRRDGIAPKKIVRSFMRGTVYHYRFLIMILIGTSFGVVAQLIRWLPLIPTESAVPLSGPDLVRQVAWMALPAYGLPGHMILSTGLGAWLGLRLRQPQRASLFASGLLIVFFGISIILLLTGFGSYIGEPLGVGDWVPFALVVLLPYVLGFWIARRAEQKI